MPDDAFVQSLVAFAHELRDAGVSVGSGDVVAYTTSVATLDPGDLVDVYWGGRTTLVARVDDIPVYDRVFRRFFLDARRRTGRGETVQRAVQGRRAGGARAP